MEGLTMGKAKTSAGEERIRTTIILP